MQMLYDAPLLRLRLICANVVCYILLVTDIKKPVYAVIYFVSTDIFVINLHCIHLGRDCRPARLLFFTSL